jgi:chorismate mutase/prephenate dehydrogenase
MSAPDELDALRAQLSAVDDELLQLVARRQSLSLQIGRAKRELGLGTRDFSREKVVLDLARHRATARGLPPTLAERIMLSLIEASLSAQEQDRVSRAGTGTGRRALVIGGSGKMGAWFVSFLANQGWSVEVADPTPPADPSLGWTADWRDRIPLHHDLVIVATPLSMTASVLEQLALVRPTGVIVDVGSLKRPLRPGLEALRAAGCKVTSVHPMFGPDTNLLSGRHVLFIDLGVPEATALVRELFAATMAVQSDVDLDTHDRLMAFVLGLSHALNLAFNQALANSGEELPLLARISSSTFEAQLGVANRVAHENPHLYYEIQALNDYGPSALAALASAVDELRRHVGTRDEAGFVEMMTRGRDYLDDRRRGGL